MFSSKGKIKFIAVTAVAILTVAVMVMLLNADGGTQIVGTWEYDSEGWRTSDQIVTFNKNGSFYDPNGFMVNVTSGKWEIISDGKLYLDWGANNDILDYELSGRTLVIDGEEYTKK